MPEQFDTRVGLSAAGGTWNFSIDADGNLELRSNSPSGGGEVRVLFHDDTGEMFFGSSANPSSIEVVSSIQVYDSADILRLRLSGDDHRYRWRRT